MDISKSFFKQFITSIIFIVTFGFGQANPSFSFNAFINPENVEIEILKKINGLLVSP